MKLNKFENRQLAQINKTNKQLNEGFGSTLLNLLFGKKFKKIVKSALDSEEDFPEYQAALMDLKAGYERIAQLKARIDKRNKELK